MAVTHQGEGYSSNPYTSWSGDAEDATRKRSKDGLDNTYCASGTTITIIPIIYQSSILGVMYNRTWDIASVSGAGSYTYTSHSTDLGTLQGVVITTAPGTTVIRVKHHTWASIIENTEYYDITITTLCNITWANGDEAPGEAPLAVSYVSLGDVPVYSGPAPSKDSYVDNLGYYHVYVLDEDQPWSPTPVAATGDATYTAVFVNKIVDRDQVEGRFFPDDCPFVLVFDPAGGSFQSGNWITSRDMPIPSITYTINNVSTTENLLYDNDTVTGKGHWLWFKDTTATEISDISINNIPYSEGTGLTPPPGIGHATQWSITAPYEHSVNGSTWTGLKLRRSSQDSICQKTIYPDWEPIRSTQQRAFLMAPGYGSIDLGHIQGITESYSSSVIQTPIAVFGYAGAFCMDMGVKKEITLNYIRTQPTKPDNNSGDSREWTNSQWLESLKKIMNRWQLMTNGNRFYLLRPKSDVENDPMLTYTDEIKDLNCYVSNLPIPYGDTPQAIKGSITLAVGTLYPKQRELTQKKIVYNHRNSNDPNNSDYNLINGDISTTTAGKWLSVPSPNILWHPTTDWSNIYGVWEYTHTPDVEGGSTYTAYANANTIVDLNQVAENNNGELIFTARVDYSGTAIVIKATKDNVTPGTEITRTFEAQSAQVAITMACVGGGGGGGCGRIAETDDTSRYYAGGGSYKYNWFRVAGGGGGGSGSYDYKDFISIGNTGRRFTVKYTIGAGGTGGANPNNAKQTGGNGSPSTVTISVPGDSWAIRGNGGSGGEGANDTWPGDAAKGGAGGSGLASANGGNGGQKNIPSSGGGMPTTPAQSVSAGNGGTAGDDRYSGSRDISIRGSDGNWGRPCDGIDVGGGGAGAVCYSDISSTPGRGGDGAWAGGTAGDGRLGSGGGGGGGAQYVGSDRYLINRPADLIPPIYNSLDAYNVLPGGSGGDGWVYISLIGVTEITQ